MAPTKNKPKLRKTKSSPILHSERSDDFEKPEDSEKSKDGSELAVSRSVLPELILDVPDLDAQAHINNPSRKRRVTLRQWRFSDLSSMTKGRSDPGVQYWYGQEDAPRKWTDAKGFKQLKYEVDQYRKLQDRDDLYSWVDPDPSADDSDSDDDDDDDDECVRYAFALAVDDVVAGQIVLRRESRVCVELMYWLDSDWRGHGLMPVAVAEVARWAIDNLSGILRVEANIASGNSSSRNVLLKTALKHEETVRNVIDDEGVVMDAETYAIVLEPKEGSGQVRADKNNAVEYVKRFALKTTAPKTTMTKNATAATAS